ncbi:MAG: type II toxin-antitoxin system VapC family toxin [Candidatus Margulisbacteria bacterium]|nr:type II toxin-antitoxin system VapC family toxin [Candidatus Margulisiibacteriota bacterium]
MKKTVYLDTTIPSYYFDERDAVSFQSKVTKQWFAEESKKFNIYISVGIIDELDAGNYPKKDEILKFSFDFELLETNSLISDIVEVYVKNHLMPKDYQGDALHLAICSYYKIDFLLTWNCNHLANANKKQHIKVINTKLNLPSPEIITPLELFSESK